MERAKDVLKSLFNALSGPLLGRGRERRRPAGLRGWDAPDTDHKIPFTILVVHAMHEQRVCWARQNRWSVRESTVSGLIREGSGKADQRCGRGLISQRYQVEWCCRCFHSHSRVAEHLLVLWPSERLEGRR